MSPKQPPACPEDEEEREGNLEEAEVEGRGRARPLRTARNLQLQKSQSSSTALPLPTELFLDILDDDSLDESDLAACALVCRSMVPLVRPSLYYAASFDFDRTADSSLVNHYLFSSGSREVWRNLVDQPAIGVCLLRLEIRLREVFGASPRPGTACQPDPVRDELVQVLNNTPHLDALIITADDGCDEYSNSALQQITLS
ncbi:hypothetical protein JCM8097_007483, partial [Rhodosporidiobolus ruineniae]